MPAQLKAKKCSLADYVLIHMDLHQVRKLVRLTVVHISSCIFKCKWAYNKNDPKPSCMQNINTSLYHLLDTVGK